LQGLRDWREQGLNPPNAIKDSTGRYRHENDSVGQWIEAACVLGQNCQSTMKDLHASYKNWCENSDLIALSNTCFGKELTRRAYPAKRLASGTGRTGIRLKENRNNALINNVTTTEEHHLEKEHSEERIH
jgi:putative DNA primase/helicase